MELDVETHEQSRPSDDESAMFSLGLDGVDLRLDALRPFVAGTHRDDEPLHPLYLYEAVASYLNGHLGPFGWFRVSHVLVNPQGLRIAVTHRHIRSFGQTAALAMVTDRLNEISHTWLEPGSDPGPKPERRTQRPPFMPNPAH